MTLDFQPWPKIARLNRDIVITEKIDGTNAAIVIVNANQFDYHEERALSDAVSIIAYDAPFAVRFVQLDDTTYVVFAQSRTRFITPQTDNFGFAAWVHQNAQALVETLGEGTHYGEWWGSGIQRGYGLPKGYKRFSLFNTARWGDSKLLAANNFPIPSLGVVPVLYEGPFDQTMIEDALNDLEARGSQAAPGFTKPEGIVIYHTALREMFKVTLEGDEAPKNLPRDAHGNAVAA